MNTLFRIVVIWIAGWAFIASAHAQVHDWNSAAVDVYSAGVHAYFAGRASEAEANLSRAIEIAHDDPRPYYFRALSLLRLGRTSEARQDMSIGAALEANRANRYAVGRALQRVQGSDRLLLEKYRRAARSQATTVSEERRRARTRQLNARDEGALRQRVVIPLEELLRPGGPQPLSPEELERRAAAARQSRTVQTEPVAPPPTREQNPFEDDAPAASAEPPTPEPAVSLPESKPAEQDIDENPFGNF